MRDQKSAAAPRQVPSIATRVATASLLVIAAMSAAVSAGAQGMGDRARGADQGMAIFGGPPRHIGRGIDRMLDGLNATDAQRTQIKQIALAAAVDLKVQREAGRALRDKGAQIFAAPTVDAAAAESLRQQMLVHHDQASKRTLQAMLEVSNVLTPEQRVKFVERTRQRHDIMHERMQREHGLWPQK